MGGMTRGVLEVLGMYAVGFYCVGYAVGLVNPTR